MPNQRSLLIPKRHLFIASSSAPSSLLTGLVSYWKMNESSAGVAPVTRVDSVVASANDLSDTNNTPSATGILGNGASFTAALNQCLTIASNALLQTGDIDFTCSFWLNLPVLLGLASIHVIGKANNNGISSIEWKAELTAVNAIRFRVSNGAVVTNVGATVLSASTWYFVVVYHDSVNNIISIQINNGAATQAAYSNGVAVTALPFNIGGDSVLAQASTSIVDEVGFWKRILTAPEITSLYNGGVGLTYPF